MPGATAERRSTAVWRMVAAALSPTGPARGLEQRAGLVDPAECLPLELDRDRVKASPWPRPSPVPRGHRADDDALDDSRPVPCQVDRRDPQCVVARAAVGVDGAVDDRRAGAVTPQD